MTRYRADSRSLELGVPSAMFAGTEEAAPYLSS